jgi:hypothetical protein
MLISIRKILIGGPIRSVLKRFRLKLNRSDDYRKKLKKKLRRLPKDRDWRIHSPCPLTPSRLLSIVSAYENQIELPPIILQSLGSSGFFRIINGRHRLTMAIALGRTYIEAELN